MGVESGIAWTDNTFNGWIGCQKVSEACKNCYAEVSTPVRRARAKGLELWGPDANRMVTSDEYWRQPLRWDAQAKRDGRRIKVFCSSLADVFEDHPSLSALRDRLFLLIHQTPNLTWQLLTKRPELVKSMVPWQGWAQWPNNVWLGTTVENQKRADERILHLLDIPAHVRFLSCEPLLEEVNLGFFGTAPREISPSYTLVGNMIDWVIVGGESGVNARPFNIAWARSIVEQCRKAEVACFVKQLGAHPYNGAEADGEFWNFETWVNKAKSWIGGTGALCFDAKRRPCVRGADFMLARDEGAFPVSWHLPMPLRDRKGGDMAEWPDDLRVQQIPFQGEQ